MVSFNSTSNIKIIFSLQTEVITVYMQLFKIQVQKSRFEEVFTRLHRTLGFCLKKLQKGLHKLLKEIFCRLTQSQKRFLKKLRSGKKIALGSKTLNFSDKLIFHKIFMKNIITEALTKIGISQNYYYRIEYLLLS